MGTETAEPVMFDFPFRGSCRGGATRAFIDQDRVRAAIIQVRPVGPSSLLSATLL